MPKRLVSAAPSLAPSVACFVLILGLRYFVIRSVFVGFIGFWLDFSAAALGAEHADFDWMLFHRERKGFSSR